MKKTISILPFALSAMLFSQTAFAASPSVIFNGEKLEFETEPYIEDDLTMVPFRAIFEAAEINVIWEESAKTIIAIGEINGVASSIALQIDSADAFVNGVKYELEKPAVIRNDNTFVPLRFVMESLGADVQWDEGNYSVIITTEKGE